MQFAPSVAAQAKADDLRVNGAPFEIVSRPMMNHPILGLLFLTQFAAATAFARRPPDISVEEFGWGNASSAEIRAVFRAAAGEIWKHCPATRVDPIFVHRRSDHPQTDVDRDGRGRIAIGIASGDLFLAQLGFQFAHEFCHVLTGHSNDWRRQWRVEKRANQWLEESLCETASLFTLRAMARSWRTDAPFQSWSAYAPEFENYASASMRERRNRLPSGMTFPDWFRRNEPAMRRNPGLRDRNAVVAAQLLPLFEAEPRGWEAVTFLNLGRRDPQLPLARFLAEWRGNCPRSLRDFITRIALIFEVRV